MKIGIIDADLVGRKEHRFPNLASMKLSGFHKNQGHDVELISFHDIDPSSLFKTSFDKVYISKVFTDTKTPDFALKLPFVEYGGTGFFYDKAPNLPDEIEHCMPDYNLYDKWVKEKIRKGKKTSYFKYYTDYSIGFTSRKCFRKCSFCVNRNYDKVEIHSPISEFLDASRKKICLLDDNVLGCGRHWERIIKELQATKKPFQFKQGLDIRILSDKKASLLSKSKYDDRPYFAFDNISDYDLIERKLKILNKHFPNKKQIAIFYTICAFDENETYDSDFWVNDIENLFIRVRLLIKYNCTPYVMRFDKFKESPFKSTYIKLAAWANQNAIFKKKSFNEFLEMTNKRDKFKDEYPVIANKYYNLKFGDVLS